MLTGFRVENFKAFQDTGTISLAPVTLLSGINSAGKSSLIQMLLLLKQTLESGPAQVLNPGQGPFLQQSLGDNFNDFLFGRPRLSEASLTYHLTFAYERDDEADVVGIEGAKLYDALNLLLTDLAVSPTESATSPGRLSAEVVVTFDWGANGRGATVRVANLQIKLLVDERPLVGLQGEITTNGEYKVRLDGASTHQINDLNSSPIEIVEFSHFLPDSLGIYGTQNITISLARLFHRFLAAVRRDLSGGIYYLSSFRTAPLRVYTTGQTAGMVLNPAGSNFAEVLWRFREQVVRFVHSNGDEEKLPLRDMVARVLSDTLGLTQRVTVNPVAKGLDILEVKVESLGPTSTLVTLPDVGLGYNQILPTIVQGLLTPPGALVIFEQPEIHLHPEIQARLIHFFAGLARAGRRVLVETHSTHMVDHLCLAIVKDRSNWLAENSEVLFIHPPDKTHASARIEPVQINRYGKILNYPAHFLPDVAAIYGEILKEGFAKRREERASRSSVRSKAKKERRHDSSHPV